MIIEKVKELQGSYLVNDTICVPKSVDNSDYQKIQRWVLEGGIVEQEDLLSKVKLEKAIQIKSLRDQRNTEPITDHKAFLLDDEGSRTSEESYFLFYTNRHQTNPASDPDSIINRAIEMGSMPYFTKDIQGNKIIIELTAELARSLRQTIANRNDMNYRNASETEVAIKAANTIQEVEAILG